MFWLPSEQETFGLVVVEAAAANLPVVLRNIPDYKETFANDVLLVNEETVTDTLQMLRDDSKFYSASRARAKVIAERYDSTANASKVIDIYKQLLV